MNLRSYTFLKRFIIWDKLDSTNDYLKEYFFRYPEGTILIADKQQAGRGRFKNNWESPEGGLWFSLLRRKNSPYPVEKTTMLNMVYEIPYTLIKVLEGMGLDVFLKWPNDVYLEGKKLAGILPEVSVKAGKIEKFIVGCGINVKNKISQELEAKAIRLLDFLSEDKCQNFYYSFWQTLDKTIKKVETDRFFNILSELTPYWWGIGKKYILKTSSGKEYHGIIQTITDSGELILLLSDGKKKSFSTGEIFSLD